MPSFVTQGDVWPRRLPACGASGAEETQRLSVGVDLVGGGWSGLPWVEPLDPPPRCSQTLSLAGGADDAWADAEDITEEDCALRSVPHCYGLGWCWGRVSDQWWPFSY